MAGTCPNCGSATEPSVKFCPACGRALTAPPSGSSVTTRGGPNSAIKVILVVVAVFVGLGVLSMGACLYIAHRARQHFGENLKVTENGKTVTVETPQGPIVVSSSKGSQDAASTAAADELAYPGATLKQDTTVAGGDQRKGMRMEQYETVDSAEKVAAFYKEKLGSKASEIASGGNTEFILTTDTDTTTVSISPAPSGSNTSILIDHLRK